MKNRALTAIAFIIVATANLLLGLVEDAVISLRAFLSNIEDWLQ